ncbi:MAG: hypothetical protein U0941_26160 [Planctomycetaceae bacterium]
MRLLMILTVLYSSLSFAEDAPKPVTPAVASTKIKEKVTVEMLVKSTGGRENCYLNSEEDFKLDSNFTIFISKDVKDKMKKVGIENPGEHFKQKTIQVTGTVILVEKKPRISITEPEQVKILDKKN